MRELYKKHMPVNMTSLNKLRTSIGTTGYFGSRNSIFLFRLYFTRVKDSYTRMRAPYAS